MPEAEFVLGVVVAGAEDVAAESTAVVASLSIGTPLSHHTISQDCTP